MEILIPSYSLNSLIYFLCDLGAKREELLSLLSTDENTISDSHCTFLMSDYEAMLTYGVKTFNVSNIGFEHGKHFDVSCWGILGHIAATSKNLLQALTLQKKYQCLFGNAGQAYYEAEDEHVIMRWLSENQCSANAIEQVITAWVAFAFSVVKNGDKPLSVNFTHDCMASLEDYERFFGCPVNFNANFNGVVISASSLEVTLKSFNEDVLNVLCCHADNLLAAKRVSASIDIIIQYITQVLPDHVPDLQEISQHLGLSARQLQRKFSAQNTNLTLVLEQLRQRLAIAYLTQTDHKILYISTMLGYSEQSAFQRAFKRWYDVTPQNFRLKPSMKLSLNSH